MMKTITVVGASLAGLSAVRALRAQGFDGRIVVVGEERHRPYDRPPLSKDVLLGTGARGGRPDGPGPDPGPDRLALPALTDSEEEAELGAEWLLGTRADALEPASRRVRLSDGSAVFTDGVVIATGAAATWLPAAAPPPGGRRPAGVHTLRTFDDALALRTDLAGGAARVVVVGAGFIGAEVASSCAALGLAVTVVEVAPLPLIGLLGEQPARVCAALHADHGVALRCGTGVRALHAAHGRVAAVELTDGSLLPADVVVLGVGARPRTEWLAGSGIALDDGVVCDAGCVTGIPAVVAAGDVARVAGFRDEHWASATGQPATAVRNLLAGRTVQPWTGVPSFWSDQYGCRIQFAGRRVLPDTVRIAEGDPADRSFLAVYERDGRITAALAMNRPRSFQRVRRREIQAPVTSAV